MYSLNEHQLHLWKKMISIIENYQIGKISYNDMVGELEGTLDAGEFNDQELIEKWYDLWTPLEIERAKDERTIKKTEIKQYIKAMKAFLEDVFRNSKT